jgi:transcriptional regulator with XRE-family HTH domain
VPTIKINTAIRTSHDAILVPNAVLCQAIFTENRNFVRIHKKGGTELGTLYENIISLCNEKGIKGGKMCTDIGMSKGILTDLKMGRQFGISATNAQKIASYFGVSVGYLLGEEDKKEKPADDGGLTENQKALMEFARSVPDDQAAMVLRVIRSIVEGD